MTTTLHPPITSTRQLTWNPYTKQYVGEVSSTNGFGRVHADSCDEGMTLHSAKTGRTIVFVIDEVTRDAEGEVVSWLLRPLSVIGTAITSVTVLLFND